jgi:hypothetical protein
MRFILENCLIKKSGSLNHFCIESLMHFAHRSNFRHFFFSTMNHKEAALHLICVLQRECLEVGRLHLVQHHSLSRLVPRGVQLLKNGNEEEENNQVVKEKERW